MMPSLVQQDGLLVWWISALNDPLRTEDKCQDSSPLLGIASGSWDEARETRLRGRFSTSDLNLTQFVRFYP